MTNKTFISRLFLLIVLATTIFQIQHSYAHLMEQLEAPICHHEDSTSRKQITHAHHYSEPCSVCSYSVSSFLPTSIQFFDTVENRISQKKNPLYLPSAISFFSGSLFGLRAPPVV